MTNNFTWSEYDYSFIATSSSTTLTFTGADSQGLFQGLDLDDVTLQVAGVTHGVETTNGTVTFTDADATDTHTISVVAEGNNYVGTFTPTLASDTTNGQAGLIDWTFSASDSAIYAGVAAQQTVTQTYAVTVDDGHGGQATQDVTVTVTNPDHAPVITDATASGTITEFASDPTGNLIVNGGFETGGVDPWSWSPYSEIVLDAPVFAHSGGDAYVAATYTSGQTSIVETLGQTFATIPGLEYQVQFWLTNDSGSGPNSATVTWNGANVATLTNLVGTDTGNGGVTYTEYTYDVTATSMTSQLEFAFKNDVSSFYLDDVSVNAVAGQEASQGTIHFTDADATDTHVISFKPDVAGYIGNFAVNLANDSGNGQTGTVDWTFSVQDSAIGFLAEGQTIQQSYTVTIDDGFGGKATDDVVVTIVGSDHPPTPVADVVNVNEDATAAATTRATGVLGNDTDPDAGDAATLTVSAILAGTTGTPIALAGGVANVAGTYGTLTINPDGTYSYTPNNHNAEALAQGQQAQDVFTYTAEDSSGETGTTTLTFDITGQNDAPVITPSTQSGTVTEGATPISTANVVVNGGFESGSTGWIANINATIDPFFPDNSSKDGDVFGGGSLSQTLTTVAGDQYTLTFFQAAGEFNSSPNSFSADINGSPVVTVNNLVQTGYAEETVTFTATSDATQLAFLATGNANYYLDNVSVVALPGQPGAEHTSGTINFTDVDLTDTHTVTVATPIGSNYLGTFAAGIGTDTNGGNPGTVNWTFTVDDAVIAANLAAGQSVTQTYTVDVLDGNGGVAPQTVTVTIDNPDHAPVNSAPTAEHVEAGVNLVLSGANAISVSDVDSPVLTETLTVSHGALTLNGVAGLTFTVGDGVADASMTFSGTQNAINAALDGLTYAGAPGYTGSDTLAIATSDGILETDSSVALTIATNEPPVITGFTNGSTLGGTASNIVNDPGFETPLAGSGWTVGNNDGGNQINSGVSHSGTHSFQFDQTGSDATLTQTLTTAANANYTITFWLENQDSSGNNTDFNVTWNGTEVLSLVDLAPASGFFEYTLNVTAGPGTTSTLVFGGRNDPAWWYLDDVSVTPIANMAQGTVSFTDQDTGDTHTVTYTPDGANYIGTFTPIIAADSTGGVTGTVDWTFNVSPSAVAYLAAGQTLTQSYTVDINDGHGSDATQDVSVTITGLNDAPVLTSGTQSGSVTQHVPASVETTSGGITFTDADLTDTHTITVVPGAGGYVGELTASMVADATGGRTGTIDWTYTVNDASIASLGAGQSLTQTYTVDVNDGNGGIVPQTVTVTINGVNDAPALNINDKVALNDEAKPSLTNLVSDPGFETSINGSAWMANGSISTSATQHSGSVSADSTGTSTGSLSQTITTVSGEMYTVTFWVAASNTSNDTFTASWNGTQLVSLSGNQLSSTFAQETFQVAGAAGATSTSLAFTLKDSSNNQHVFLDDVSVTPAGTFVSSLVGIGSGTNNVTDLDSGAKTGIAITGTGGLSGTWFYSLNAGATWATFPTVSATNALLLAADSATEVYFVPTTAGATGNATITFDAWDQTTGSNGGTANPSTTGGSTAFSTGSETASLTVGTPTSGTSFMLTSGADNVFFVGGANTITGTDSTLQATDSVIGGTGTDTFNLTVASGSAYSFNFGGMANFIGIDDVALAANTSQHGSVSLTFTDANILSGQTLTVDGHSDSTQAFAVDASAVNDGGNFIFIASSSTNSLKGGTGNDLFQFTSAEFIAAATVAGGGGIDTIQITDTGSTGYTIADSAFAHVTGVEILKVASSGTDTITLGTDASVDVGGAGNTLTVSDTGTGNLTVNGLGMTANLIVIAGTGTADNLTGGSGNDTFELTKAHFHGLATPQTINGDTGSDTIWVTDTTAITIADADFAHVTNIETLKIGGTAADNVTLGTNVNTEIGGAGHTFTVDDSTGSGALTVNGSALVANLLLELNSPDFTSSDHVIGGSGSDEIKLVDQTGIVVVDSDFTNVTSVETLALGGAAANSVTLGADASADVGGAGHTFTLDETAATGNLFLDATGMTANLQVLLDGIGNDILSGGAGNDIFEFTKAPANGDIFTNFNNTTQQDTFAVSVSGFGGASSGLTVGQNVAAVFETSGDNNFTSGTDRFHFDTANHGLYYSPDGTTAHEVLLATVTNGVSIHGSDIHTVA